MNEKQQSVYIVDCIRTPIGSANKSLKKFEAHELASFVIKGLIDANGSVKDKVSEVILGNAVSAGTGQNLARRALKGSSLPLSIPAYVVNNVCGSGLQAVLRHVVKLRRCPTPEARGVIPS